MAKKKEENKEPKQEFVSKAEFEAVQSKLKEYEQTFENFRISFQNIETKLKNLVERNRLR